MPDKPQLNSNLDVLHEMQVKICEQFSARVIMLLTMDVKMLKKSGYKTIGDALMHTATQHKKDMEDCMKHFK